MSQQSDCHQKNLFGTSSPATKYEAILLEKGGLGTTEEKIILVFEILDELIPNLGVYCKLVELLRKEMFDAVYSEQYTGSKEKEDQDTGGYIQRVPYFTLARRVYSERDERAESLSHQLETVKEMLFEKHKQYEKSQEKVLDLESEVQELKNNITDMQHSLQKKNEKISELEGTLEEERAQAAQTEQTLTCELQDLQEDLTESHNEVAFLMQFKLAYDHLQNAFTEHPGLADTGAKKRKAVVSNKKAKLISSVESSIKLEKQILQVQNNVIEEFDNFLEEHKRSLSSKQGLDLQDLQLYEQQELEIDQEDQQLMVMQERFRRSMDQITVELELLKQHKLMLEEQLQSMQDNKPISKTKKQKNKQIAMRGKEEDGTEVELEDEEQEKKTDPFIPQERVFSKYAAMMYTSTDGKTFHEFKDAKYCPSCGEKTVFCPHKIGNKDKVFVMPPEVTHVKVVRPKVRICKEILQDMIQEPALSPRIQQLCSHTAIAKKQGQQVRQHAGTQAAMNMSTATQAPILAADAHLPYTEARLWEDYQRRTALERTLPRPLDMDHTISLLETFAASVFWMDENGTEEDGFYSFLDSLYRFMSERYLNPEIMYLSAHDFLSALSKYSHINKTLLLFVFVLVGNLDAAVFRYLLLLNDFIDQVDWWEVEDFQSFAAVIYPFLSEDDLETMQMGYTAYSENKISKQLVSEYIIYCIMKYREPRFLEFENKLLNTPGKEMECMTEKEFLESSDNVLQVVNAKLRCRLFREAQQDQQQAAVPILRLAQITSYLALLQLAPVIRETLATHREEARACRASKALATHREEATASSKTESTWTTGPGACGGQDFLITMSKARNLAYNISRRKNRRRTRRQHPDDEM